MGDVGADRRDAVLRTDRLVLRRWRAEDREPFAEMNADSRTMEFFPSTMTRQESDELAERADRHLAEHGWGLFAVEVPGGPEFIGFVGLQPVLPPIPCAPAVEIGWRLAAKAWGHGYAPEAARACLALGFGDLGLEEIVSFTSVVNHRSRRVMEKIGMTRLPADDFDHPRVGDGPLRRQVLYRLDRERFATAATGS
jgi:RimJ/RimL family protein N-acetyltransferase